MPSFFDKFLFLTVGVKGKRMICRAPAVRRVTKQSTILIHCRNPRTAFLTVIMAVGILVVGIFVHMMYNNDSNNGITLNSLVL